MSTYIIVEGPDGAGKSTLINQLVAQYGTRAVYMHFGVPEDYTKQFGIYAEAIRKYADAAKVVIFDRCWYSDRVYAPIMRGRIEMSALEAQALDCLVTCSGGGLLVYCTAPDKVLWKRCIQRGETYIKNIEQLSEISAGYSNVIRGSMLPTILYNTALSI